MDFISPDPVALHARLRPEATACVNLTGNRNWSYRELDTDIQRAVTVLRAEGIVKGDRVAVLARNNVRQVILQQALMRLGAIFVPLNWRLSQHELGLLLKDCTPSILYTDEEIPELQPGCRAKSF